MNKKNWDDIRFVLTVARLGSLNAAATKLGVTHATVMRRVAAFESNHGQRIFLKSPSGYKVLPEAVPILRSIETIEDATISMERAIAGSDQSLRGSVRIASTDSMCYLMLPKIIGRISQKYPNIELNLLSANIHHDLSRLSADIVVRATNALDETLTGQSVGTLHFAAYSNGEPDQKWMKMEGALSGSIPAKWLTKEAPSEQIIGGADSFLVLQHLAAQGVGKAILPVFVGDAHPSLSRVGSATLTQGVKVWVATLKEYAHVPRFTSVQKLLTEELRTSEYFSS